MEDAVRGGNPPKPLSALFGPGVLTLLLALGVADEATAFPNPSPKKPGFWKSLNWKLMLGLLFPVTLETLDYTGSSLVYS